MPELTDFFEVGAGFDAGLGEAVALAAVMGGLAAVMGGLAGADGGFAGATGGLADGFAVPLLAGLAGPGAAGFG